MKYWILVYLLFLMSAAAAQQIADDVYWIYFTDKNDNAYQMNQPGKFLSERSVSRRAWQGLGVDQTDEPVTRAYVDELKGMGVEIRHVSRWLNGLAMIDTSGLLYQEVLDKPFVDTLPWKPASNDAWYPSSPAGMRFDAPLQSPPHFDYGIATEQVEQLNLDVLHQDGYTGRGVWVAVLDAGFKNVDTLPAFSSMISEGRLLGTRNFIADTSVYRMVNSHGMYVLSIIGAGSEGQMIGTAPHASFYLCATENVIQETRIEEIAWIEAAEFMDSLGFDVFNTSLGYSDFDGTRYDYTYQDMDGRTSFISRAASMLAAKGIVLCQSAGNAGNNPWFRIIAAADAFDILSAGAVDSEGEIAYFSSRGPSWDGRVKPELVAMGRGTGRQYVDGSFNRGSGTSFSAPLLSGSVASLWQAYPELSAKELIYRIRDAGDRFENPDNSYGFGIPNFAKAYWQISREREVSLGMLIYPNPACDHLQIHVPGLEPDICTLNFYDMSSRRICTKLAHVPGELSVPSQLTSGVYILELITSRGIFRTRLMKL